MHRRSDFISCCSRGNACIAINIHKRYNLLTMAPKRTSSRNSGRKDEGEQSPDDNNNAGVFLSKLAEALSACGSHDWKVRVI